MPHPSTSLSNSLVLVLAASGYVVAEDANPSVVTTGGKPAVATAAPGESTPTHSWDMPALTVDGTVSHVHEAQRIGDYGQPRWTARRLFAETRVYVIPEGQFEFEYWLVVEGPQRKNKDAGDTTVKQLYEAEMGLPYRFQIDLYQQYVKKGSDGVNQLDSTKFEVRWAFADWDVIPTNPTAYVEWAQAADGYDSIEGKLLLADEASDRLHWGVNLVWEEETGGARARSQEITSGQSYAVIDSKFAIGLEEKLAFVNEIEEGERTPYETELLIGPSIQIRPQPQMHINVAWLVGLTQNSPTSKMTAVLGWEF